MKMAKNLPPFKDSSCFQAHYLRSPKQKDTTRPLAMNEEKGLASDACENYLDA
jgi:hypothetical protein